MLSGVKIDNSNVNIVQIATLIVACVFVVLVLAELIGNPFVEDGYVHEYGPSMGSLYRELDQYGDVRVFGFSYSDDYMAMLDVDNRPNVNVDIKCEGDTPEEALSCVLHKFKTIGVQ